MSGFRWAAWRRCGLGAVMVGLFVTFAQARVEIVFPTANQAWANNNLEAFVQATVSGDPESGLFGCVRTNGTQFHEGLDIKSLTRDRRGEATDEIFAAMTGIVRHINLSPGGSSYGRYIVIEHPDEQPAVYTLYAHLAKVEPGVRPGVRVARGQTIATMGRSASGSGIPKDRAHLHFEIGLRLTDQFQSWYAFRKFGSPNEQGDFNGMNLMGVDALDFLRQWRSGRVSTFQHYFDRMKPVVKFRVATTRVPDFIQRYPALLRKPISGLVAGWEVECNATGLPFSWTPLSANEVIGFAPNEVRILSVDAAIERATRCKQLVKPRRGGHGPGDDLLTMLQLVFGLR
ncbi:MAG: M23 family metallopeptidase [Candidatus Didemnitutus sp.]|nr:M23 family metallopeptidase [Candidatus Didemnitutus sp.]